MITFKYSFLSKKTVLLTALILTASSLFAFFIPEIVISKEKIKTEIESSVLFAHPLDGMSDNILVCSEDGSELHEIFLCGASAERLISTNIANLQSATWSKLADTQTNCSSALNCPKNSPGCNWDDLSTDTQYNVTQGGEYRILVRYSDNSTARFYFNVYTNGLNPNPVVTNIDCGNPGSITVNNVPSTYEYSINNGATWQISNVFSITSVSSYDILIRRQNDTDGCQFNLDAIEVNNNAIDATATLLPITCDSALGAIQVNVNSASSTFVYEISQGGSLINSSGPLSSSSFTFTDLNAGVYDINVRLASVSACSWDAQETVIPFANVQPEAVVTKNIDCTDGVITVTKNGGEAPFEYSLNGSTIFTSFTSGNQTTIPIETSDSYTVTVRDASGCTIDAAPINVVAQPEVTFTIASQDITCNGTDDGSITIDMTATQGYSISYSKDGGTTFQTSNVFSNLAVATYSVIIRKQKAGGVCDLDSIAVAVDQSPAFTASSAVTQEIDCTNGEANIEATVTAGGSAPFEYSLDGVNFQPSPTFTGLGPGDYTITVQDVNGCLTTIDQAVSAGSNPSDLTFLTSGTDCSTGQTNVQITVQNGNAPFTYAITAPSGSTITAPDDTFTALAPNTYTFEITADDGCKIIRNFVVPEPIQFTSSALVKTNISCIGMTDGSIEVSVENFNTSYTVVVEDSSGTPLGLGLTNQTTSSLLIPGLADDAYTVKISDESGPCQKEETLTIAAPAAALAFAATDPIVIANINCGAPGSVTVEVTGGWGNYRYSVEQPDGTITPFQSNKTITGLLQENTHTLTVVDANGCSLTTDFDLIDQGGPIAEVDQDQSVTTYCYSISTPGELKIDVTDNGTAPYFYTVNDGTPIPITGGTFTLSNLTPANYVVKVKGNNGCETIVTDTNISGQLFAFANITKPLGCGTPPDAVIQITPENGYPPYTYEVDSGSGYVATAMPFSTNTAGSYIFKITDDKGCEFYIGDPDVAAGLVNGTEQPVEVTVAPSIVPAATSLPTACGKDGTGSITLSAGGGTPPFEFAFSTTPFDPVSNAPVFSNQTLYNNLDATTYYYQVRDALGCLSNEEIEVIGAEAAITAEIDKWDISCDPAQGGNIWGNIKVSDIQNSTGLVNISLVRVQDPVAYAAGNDTRTWTYRNYTNIDLATNSNYNTAYQPTIYNDPITGATKTGYDIRMYWGFDFVVRIQDEKGCFWESEIQNIFQPQLPVGRRLETDFVQSCANGATFGFNVTNYPGETGISVSEELVGPFSYRVWPYDEDNPPTWRSFENAADNPALGVTPDGGNIIDVGGGIMKIPERDLQVGGLIFGVNYSLLVRDEATGCLRWLRLGIVNSPEAPNNDIDVVSTVQGTQCYGAADGRVRVRVTGADDNGVTDANGDSDFSGPDGNRTVKWNVRLTSDLGVGNNSPASREATFASYRQNGVHIGPATGDFDIDITGLRTTHYVVEIETESTCKSGNRFYIHRPATKLLLREDNVVQPTCLTGGQVAVTATGGWDNEEYFNRRNKLEQNWNEYEYALVLDSATPTDLDFGPDNLWTNVVPTSYTGGNNVYRAWVRDGGGCMVPLTDVITFIEAPTPEIDGITVSNRCTSTNEIYNVEATLLNPGTNPVEGVPIYIWDGQATTNTTAQLGPGNHTLEVRDENGCSVSQNIFIYPQMAEPTAQITQQEQCSPNNSGEVTIDQYGGSDDYTYEKWVGGTLQETHVSGAVDAKIFTGLTHSVAYRFVVRDNLSGCAPKETTISLDVPVLPQFDGEVVQHLSCNGANDGIIRIFQVSGANNLDIPYEYSLDGTTYQTSNLFSGLSAATYGSINVRSSKNCIKSIEPQIIAEPLALGLTAALVSTTVTCTNNQLDKAQIIATPSGGTGPFQYSFDGGSFTTSNTYDIPYLSTAQTILIDVIDVNNCSVPSGPISFTLPAANKISATITETIAMSCVNDGVYEINIDPSFTNFSISELPGASPLVSIVGTTVTIQAGNPNAYSFFITDNDTGCTTKVTQLIAPFDAIALSANKVSDAICFNTTDGTLDFTATGFGAGGFGYEVFLANGTSQQAYVSPVSSTTALLISNLPAGTFYVEVTDIDTGCTAQSNIISIQSPVAQLDFSIATTQILTCIGNDAQITLTPTGGWGGYEFEVVETVSGNIIQDFDANNVIDNLTGINYQVRIRDSQGCTPPSKTSIISPIDVIAIDESTDVVINNPTCPGDSDGEITVTVARTNGPNSYDYSLTNLTTGITFLPETSNETYTFSNLLAGSYTVTVQDKLNCFDTTDTLVLTDPFVLEINGAITQIHTCADDSGQITVNATGNPSDIITYEMIRPATHPLAGIPQTSGVYSNLGPDVYEFIARNDSGCITPISVIRTIIKPEDFILDIDESNTTINCFGESDAVLIAMASGGLGEYQYEITKPDSSTATNTSGIFESLGAGSYQINAFSLNAPDCNDTKTVVIDSPQELIVPATVSATSIACFGEKTGVVTIPAQGEAPFSFYISTEPQKAYETDTFENLAAGDYTVIVQDVNGCERTTSFTVTGPSAPLLTEQVRVVDEVCSSDDNGVIEYTITGGTTPYSYTIGDRSNSYTTLAGGTLLLDNLDGGFYEIYVKDANDCEAGLIFEEVKVGSNLSAIIETLSECKDGLPFYTATVIFEDEELDTSEIVYDLDDSNPNNPDVANAQSTGVFENISTGNHTLSIVHLGTGCIEVMQINIEAQAPLTLTDQGGEINQILVEAQGGDGSYTYYFDDLVQSDNFYYINTTGTYNVRVVDGNGCETSIDVTMEYIDIEIPNFFTPDGNGYKDTWVIKNSEGFPNMFVKIYDRYGRTIKEWVGQGEWDGSYNTTDLPTGDYWYVIKLNGPRDDREFIGNVTVYR